MAKKHQIKISAKKTRSKARRSWRRRENEVDRLTVKDRKGITSGRTQKVKPKKPKKQSGTRQLHDSNIAETIAEIKGKHGNGGTENPDDSQG